MKKNTEKLTKLGKSMYLFTLLKLLIHQLRFIAIVPITMLNVVVSILIRHGN